MSSFPEQIVLTFVPIFVAIDAIGTVPLILPLSQDMTKSERIRMINIALITASAIGLAFLFIGRAILHLLGVELGPFAVAGGLILLALSLRDLVTGKMMDMPIKEELVAVVPLGTPLTVGPATITTLLLLSYEYHLGIVLISLVLNLAAAWVIFLQSDWIARILGKGGVKAVSKIAALFLAAIGVNMIFRGISLAWHINYFP